MATTLPHSIVFIYLFPSCVVKKSCRQQARLAWLFSLYYWEMVLLFSIPLFMSNPSDVLQLLEMLPRIRPIFCSVFNLLPFDSNWACDRIFLLSYRNLRILVLKFTTCIKQVPKITQLQKFGMQPESDFERKLARLYLNLDLIKELKNALAYHYLKVRLRTSSVLWSPPA